jgi:nitroreductase
MTNPLEPAALDQLFREARTRNAWDPNPLPHETWRELYELLKFGPTSANMSPGRFVFLVSTEAKARIAPHLSEGNQAKSLAAPAIVIIADDLDFAEKASILFPHNPGVAAWFKDPAVATETAFRNATLQGAYLILAARALGLDTGPMSGFDRAGVDVEFFPDRNWKSNFICSIGKGVDTSFPRLPRLPFEEACAVL